MFNSKYIFFGKKGDVAPVWWIIITALLAVLVLIFVILWFRSSGEKAFGGVGKSLDSLGDYDGDKVVNFYDKCPCTSVLVTEEPTLKGCPKGTTPEQALADSKKYTDKNCQDNASTTTITSPEQQKIAEQAKKELQLKLYDGSTQILVTGYQTKSDSISYEVSCTSCQLSVTNPKGVVSTKLGSQIYPLNEEGIYMFRLETTEGVESYTIEKMKK